MDMYTYEATNFSSDIIQGEMRAGNEDAVLNHLRQRGYVPLAVHRKAGGWLRPIDFPGLSFKKHVSQGDIGFITQELAMMLQAGLPFRKIYRHLEICY